MGPKHFVLKLFSGGYMGKFDFSSLCSMTLRCRWRLVGEDAKCCSCCVSHLLFHSRADLCDSAAAFFPSLKAGSPFLTNTSSEF